MTLFNGRNVRIREERKRLGLTQAKAAIECGVTRGQWVRYENGENKFEGAVLKAFGAIGAEIGYILTGKRTNLDDVTETIEAINAMDVSIFQLMTEHKVELKRSIDQCMNYGKLVMLKYVLELNDTDFAVFSEGVARMESEAKENKASSHVVNSNTGTVHGGQNNAKNQTIHNAPVTTNKSSIKIRKQKGDVVSGDKHVTK
ncbi:helix-turn-helix domain-containing protein [Acinetobacter puyangensis]|uniref:helix-turn-helix domain-containing protein n=1 Tax=Acinetobacter puyangensis TaxID=1096779 RepID=UPI003A4D9556